jgi:hypothetical protein
LVLIPPELGVGLGTGAAQSFARVGLTNGPVSLSSPLPLVTSIEVTSQGGNRPVVFVGYFSSAQPVIEDM